MTTFLKTYGAWVVLLAGFAVAFFTFEPDHGGLHSFTFSELYGLLGILVLLLATPVAWLASLRFVRTGSRLAWGILQYSLFAAAASFLTVFLMRMFNDDFALGIVGILLLNVHAVLAPIRRERRLAHTRRNSASRPRATP